MAVDYRYLLVDASTGKALGELPLTVSSFAYQLNAVGQMTATIPRDHRMAQDTKWALYLSTNSDREITVLRNGVPVWNGPSSLLGASLRDPTQMQVTAREAHWYMIKRTLEVDKHYNADVYYVLRSLATYFTTKTSTAGDGTTSAGSNINAALPRFTVAPATGSSEITKSLLYYGPDRHTWAEIVDGLVADPTFGLDYKMVYSGDRGTCNRTLTFGAPSLGTTRAQSLTEHMLYDFAKTEDRERAANRVHTIANGFTETLQNTGSIANGDILIESVFDKTNDPDTTAVDAFTKDARRKTQPPVAVYTATFVPGNALPWGWCEVGDRINLALGGSTILHSVGHVRVSQIEVVPPQAGNPELVTLTFGVPLDALGA